MKSISELQVKDLKGFWENIPTPPIMKIYFTVYDNDNYELKILEQTYKGLLVLTHNKVSNEVDTNIEVLKVSIYQISGEDLILSFIDGKGNELKSLFRKRN